MSRKTLNTYLRKRLFSKSWILHKHKLKDYKRIIGNWHPTDITGPSFRKNQFQLFVIYTNPNKFSAGILNRIQHVYSKDIFFSRSVFPGFRYKTSSCLVNFLNPAKLTIYIASSALVCRVWHKTSLVRTDRMTIIVTSRDFTYIVYFLVNLFLQ